MPRFKTLEVKKGRIPRHESLGKQGEDALKDAMPSVKPEDPSEGEGSAPRSQCDC